MATAVPSITDLAGVGRMRTRQDAHQRGLAGSVPADEADHLARVQVDRHVADGVDATERDVDVAHLDERRPLRDGHGRASLRLSCRAGGCSVSKPTARIRTMPATMFWPGEFTPT